MKLRDANLQVNEKNSFTHPPTCRIHHNYCFQRVLDSVRAQFLLGNIIGLLVIYLFNYDSPKSIFSMLNMNWTFS